MRWLLIKDLQLLRRSPLQAALLVVYPVLIALLVGFAISREPEKPRVAFLNEVPAGSRISVGEAELPSLGVDERICRRVACVRVANREEAIEEVRSGDALAALILPADLIDKLNSLSTFNPETPQIEVVVNQDDPLEGRIVDERIANLLAQANLAVARRIAAEGGRSIDLVVDGGTVDVVGRKIEILGFGPTAQLLRTLRPSLPAGEPRDSADRVMRFVTLARDSLGVGATLLERLAQPIVVDKRVVSEPTPPLDLFAIAVAAMFTLTFVVVLLVAGSLALEREENAFARLTRGLVGRTALLGEKIGLGVVVGLLVTLLMLAGVQLFVSLDWGRLGLWLAAIVAAGVALGAAGAALGAAARDVRAVSLLAFMVSLPIALLSLIPAGAVGAGADDAIGAITALFPFKPGLKAISGALDPASAGIGGPLLHLAVLALAYGLLARFALRRFNAA